MALSPSSRRGACRLRFKEVGDGDRVALCGELGGDCLADSARRARDERDACGRLSVGHWFIAGAGAVLSARALHGSVSRTALPGRMKTT